MAGEGANQEWCSRLRANQRARSRSTTGHALRVALHPQSPLFQRQNRKFDFFQNTWRGLHFPNSQILRFLLSIFVSNPSRSASLLACLFLCNPFVSPPLTFSPPFPGSSSVRHQANTVLGFLQRISLKFALKSQHDSLSYILGGLCSLSLPLPFRSSSSEPPLLT